VVDIADLMQQKIDAGCMSHEVAELFPARGKLRASNVKCCQKARVACRRRCREEDALAAYLSHSSERMLSQRSHVAEVEDDAVASRMMADADVTCKCCCGALLSVAAGE
jgi:hypothetical protein